MELYLCNLSISVTFIDTLKRIGRANASFLFWGKAAAQQLPKANNGEKQGKYLA